MRTLVIAEPGCTHEGRFADMQRLYLEAWFAGADVFKPQYVSNPEKMCERRHIGTDHPKRAYYERAYRWNSYPVEWLSYLAELYRDAPNMQLACTSFLPEDVATVDPFVSIHKISSFEADPALREAALRTGKRVIQSFGATDKQPYIHDDALHCVTAYPAPLESLNLSLLWFDGCGERAFVGFSDHSKHVLTGAVAVGAGAQIIEVHIRLEDTSTENPDYSAALSPSEFRTYVENIRTAERMIGDGVKRVQDCERWALPYRVTG